ncbi:MAG: glutaredoxin family protein [Burkholderiales bacterium]
MTAHAKATTLTVYGRNYCHLCEQMIAGLRQLQAGFAFEIEIVDVDENPELERRYGDQVPLLACGADEICRYRLDAAAVAGYLSKIC